MTRRLPSPIVRGWLRCIAISCKLAYYVPMNPIRRTCQRLVDLAARNGYRHDARTVYRQFIDQLAVAAGTMHDTYLHGPEAALAMVEIDAKDRTRLDELRERYGGVVACVPHNISAALSGIGFCHRFPTLLVAKNGEAQWRADIALEVFSRMGIDPLVVRGKNPLAVSRKMFDALAEHHVVVATLDNIFRKPNRAEVEVFGGQVGFNPWAARIAQRAGVPLIPAYIRSTAGKIKIDFGEPILSDDTIEVVQHYVRFFEQKILEYPENWAFLAHKRWRKVLDQACDRAATGIGVGTPFELRSKTLQRREAGLQAIKS